MDTVESFIGGLVLGGAEWVIAIILAAGVGAVLGTLLFGRNYKKRIAALEAQASAPAITQIINFNSADSANERERHLRTAVDSETAHGLGEIIRRLPQEPLGDGHTYAKLPDGTNIVSMADGSYRLALPTRLQTRAVIEGGGSAGKEPPVDDDGRPVAGKDN